MLQRIPTPPPPSPPPLSPPAPTLLPSCYCRDALLAVPHGPHSIVPPAVAGTLSWRCPARLSSRCAAGASACHGSGAKRCFFSSQPRCAAGLWVLHGSRQKRGLKTLKPKPYSPLWSGSCSSSKLTWELSEARTVGPVRMEMEVRAYLGGLDLNTFATACAPSPKAHLDRMKNICSCPGGQLLAY